MAQGQEVDRLFVGLGLDKSEFDEALQSSTEKLQDWGKSMQRAGQTLTQSITAPIAGAVGSLGLLTERTSKYAEEVELAAAQSGVGAEKIQELAFAAKTVSGVKFDSVRDGLKELALRSAEAAEGTGEAQEAFERLGISQQFLQDASTSEVLARVRREMQSLTQAQRILTSEQVFGGEAGEKFAEVMALNAEQMGRLRQEAQASGAVLGNQQVGALDALRTEYNGLLAEIKGLGRQLAVTLVPIIRSAVIPAVDSLVDGVRQAIQWFGSLSTTTKTWVGIIGGVAASLGPALLALGTLSTLLSGLPAVLSGIGTAATAAWAAFTGPVGLVVGAVASVAAGAFAVINYWEEVSSFFSDLFSGLVTMAQGFKQGFLGVWKVVAGEVSQVVLRLIQTIVGGFQDVLNAVGVSRFDSAFESVTSTVESGIQRSAQASERGAKMMDDAWGKMSRGAYEFGNDVAQVATDVKNSVLDMVTFSSSEVGSMFDMEGGGSGFSGGNMAWVRDAMSGGGEGGGDSSPFLSEGTMDWLQRTFDQVNQSLERSKTKLIDWGNAGKNAARQVSGGLGRVVGRLLTGRVEAENLGEAFKKVGRAIQRILGRVIESILQTIVKTAILRTLTQAFGLGLGLGLGGGGGGPVGGGLGGFGGGSLTTAAATGAGRVGGGQGGRGNLTLASTVLPNGDLGFAVRQGQSNRQRLGYD